MTPLYRYDLLEKIYQTIPKYENIVWHIAKTKHREKLTNDFVYSDPRIKLYEIDCLDSDVVTKRNVVFENIKDGYFYLLDDDTIFLEELYKVYKKYNDIGFEGMIVGQNNIIKNIKLSIIPEETFVDTGMVLCYFKVLEKEKWEWTEIAGRDCYFWSRCYQFFGKENTIFLDRVISHYNLLGPYIRIRKSLLFWDFKYDVYNLNLAKNYTRLALAKNHLYYLISLRKSSVKIQQINHIKSTLDAYSK
ncbi:MAG: hypothetical protein H7339_03565 [Arcicella sp.]|nr:hypothetical protein [Arcicella sp.]